MPDQSNDNRRPLQLQVVDKHGKHLPGVVVDYFFGVNHAEIQVADVDPMILIPEGIDEVRFIAKYPRAKTVDRVARSTDGQSRIQFTDVTAPAPVKAWHIILALGAGVVLLAGIVAIAFVNSLVSIFAFGILFAAALLALTFIFPNPTPFQYLVSRIILAVACAGVATLLTGFITVEIPNFLKAGGALAVFVVVFFKNPAALVAHPSSG